VDVDRSLDARANRPHTEVSSHRNGAQSSAPPGRPSGIQVGTAARIAAPPQRGGTHSPDASTHSASRERDSTSDVLCPALAHAVLDRVRPGVFVVDAQGTIRFANATGRQLLERGDVLLQHCNRITFRAHTVARCFDVYLRKCASAHGSGRAMESLSVRLVPARRTAPCYVVVSPLPGAASPDNETPTLHFTLAIYQPGAPRSMSTVVLRALYGLTPAEAVVTQCLYAGRRPDQLGSDLGISVNTVRSHMKRIFEKCDVRTQAELLQLLALGPTAL
jgi:DNA-binding CsgD family transcriptional regulator